MRTRAVWAWVVLMVAAWPALAAWLPPAMPVACPRCVALGLVGAFEVRGRAVEGAPPAFVGQAAGKAVEVLAPVFSARARSWAIEGRAPVFLAQVTGGRLSHDTPVVGSMPGAAAVGADVPVLGARALESRVEARVPVFGAQGAGAAVAAKGVTLGGLAMARATPDADPFMGFVPVWEYSAAGRIAAAAREARARGDEAEYRRLSDQYWRLVDWGVLRRERLQSRR